MFRYDPIRMNSFQTNQGTVKSDHCLFELPGSNGDSEHGIIHQIPETFESFWATARIWICSLHKLMLYRIYDDVHPL